MTLGSRLGCTRLWPALCSGVMWGCGSVAMFWSDCGGNGSCLIDRVEPDRRRQEPAAGAAAGPVVDGVQGVPARRRGGHRDHRGGVPQPARRALRPDTVRHRGRRAAAYGGAGTRRARLAGVRAARADVGSSRPAGVGLPGVLADQGAGPRADRGLVPLPVRRRGQARLPVGAPQRARHLGAVPVAFGATALDRWLAAHRRRGIAG